MRETALECPAWQLIPCFAVFDDEPNCADLAVETPQQGPCSRQLQSMCTLLLLLLRGGQMLCLDKTALLALAPAQPAQR